MSHDTALLVLGVSTAAFVPLAYAMRKLSRTFRPPVLQLEMVRKPEEVETILACWKGSGEAAAKRVIALDFGLLIAYGAGLSSLAILMEGWQPQWWWPLRGATIAASLAIAAAACDAIENVGALFLISGRRRGWPMVTSYAARAKFLMLAAVAAWAGLWVMWLELRFIGAAIIFLWRFGSV